MPLDPGPRRFVARQRTDERCEHGEGPVWDDAEHVVRYVDMLRGDVMTFDPVSGSLDRRHVSDVVGAMRPRQRGGWVLALEHDLALTEPGDWTPRSIATVITDPGVRFNDGGCDAAGGFLCGSMAYDQRPGAGALFRLGPDGLVMRVLEDVTISNGFELSPDATLAYYVDTPTRRIDVFDVGPDGRTLANRRVFVEIEPGGGLPDGLAIDVEGAVWLALFGGGSVRRYLSDGRLDAVVDVPTSQVTACTFGGDDRRELYITTSQEQLVPGSDPLAGVLFSVDVGVAGLPIRRYAG